MSQPEMPEQDESKPSLEGAHTPAPEGLAVESNRFWRWLVAGLLLLGVALTVFFALHATRSFRTFHAERGRPPHEATGDIAPWMTIPYIAAAYQVPADFLFTQLGIDAQKNDRKSLIQIERADFNGQRGVLRDKILAALDLYYAGSAVPTPVVPDPASFPVPEAPQGGAPGEMGRPDDRNRLPHEPPSAATPPDAAPAGDGVKP